VPKKLSYSAPNEWIVVADAGPAWKTPDRWTTQIAAWRIHYQSTERAPNAEGAALVGRTGINRAEYLAAIQGMRHLADEMELGNWSRPKVHLVTDNSHVCEQITGNWAVGTLDVYHRLLQAECDRVHRLTGRQVAVYHAVNGESAGADRLSRAFRSVCDERHRQVWVERSRQNAAAKRSP
jgi:ribonuclease HI